MSERNGVHLGSLSLEDRRHLREWDEVLQLVRDRTTGVARGHATGFALHGPGGVGKSFAVFQELERQGASHHLLNSRVSGRGLFDALAENTDSVLVIEDAETLLSDRNGIGVLRSALWCQPAKAGLVAGRTITWRAFKTCLQTVFCGGIVLISNSPIMDSPELLALKTRIDCVEMRPTEPQLRALVRKIAADGYEHQGAKLTPQESAEVAEFVISQAAALQRPLEIRLFINSLRDRCQWELGDSALCWEALALNRMREQPIKCNKKPDGLSRKERKKRRTDLAVEINARAKTRDEAIKMWRQETGMSRASFYRTLAELWQRSCPEVTEDVLQR